MDRLNFVQLIQREFTDYSLEKFRQDLLAGLTVGAVALPLALAFGVASGTTAAAGLVTAILAGILIGALSGAPYQISGPTGAMSAILILITQKYGMAGTWVMGVMAGVIILVVGLLRMGRYIAFIPAPVIAGFTSGIALIIFTGQIDNFLGVQTEAAESTLIKLAGYFQGGFTPDWHTIAVGGLVILIMVFWPQKWARLVPSSLVGIIAASLLSVLAGWSIPNIGEIPRTILLADRLRLNDIPWSSLGDLAAPAVSIAALGSIESLLCGAVGSKMTGIRLQANQELIAQGLGNIVIPFFGGIPATAAIARTSVAIRSGGQTRMAGIIHALTLLAAALIFAPVISQVPLAALAGVLMVTAARMSEWHVIRFIFSRRFKTAMITFSITMLATIALDLTEAILIGTLVSAAVFINSVASLKIDMVEVDPDKMKKRGLDVHGRCKHIRVAYLTGPLFFAATNMFNQAFAQQENTNILILSMRAVTLLDVSGLEVLINLQERMAKNGQILMLSGVHEDVLEQMRRGGLLDHIKMENIFWSADEAILAAEQHPCSLCAN